jgi:N-acetylgalactosamine-6-sulfatase
VFSSDNGPEVTGKGKEQGDLSTGAGLGEYYSVGETGGLRGQKRSLYSGGVGVPFIVRWPGHTPAGRVDKTTVITAVDLLPTFCAAAGVDLPQGYEPDGENLLRAFKGQSMDRTRPIYWDWRGASYGENWPRLAIRDGRWKLLMTLDRKRIELYDVVADRQQARDLSAQHPDVTQRLADAALAWRKTLPTDTPSQAISKDRRKPK